MAFFFRESEGYENDKQRMGVMSLSFVCWFADVRMAEIEPPTSLIALQVLLNIDLGVRHKVYYRRLRIKPAVDVTATVRQLERHVALLIELFKIDPILHHALHDVHVLVDLGDREFAV